MKKSALRTVNTPKKKPRKWSDVPKNERERVYVAIRQGMWGSEFDEFGHLAVAELKKRTRR